MSEARDPKPAPCGEPINEGPSWGMILAPMALFILLAVWLLVTYR